MGLKEALKDYKGKNVKLGSSASFVYCGEVTDDINKLLDDLAQQELMRIVKRCQSLQSARARHDELWNQRLERRTDEFYKLAHKSYWTMDQMSLKHKRMIEKFEKEKAHDLMVIERNLRTLPKQIETWKSYTERKVREIYPSLLEDATIIIFEGEERGNYWTVEEYKGGYYETEE